VILGKKIRNGFENFLRKLTINFMKLFESPPLGMINVFEQYYD
jgi:hypothetical protein